MTALVQIRRLLFAGLAIQGLAGSAHAQKPPSVSDVNALYAAGEKQNALALVERILAIRPNDSTALFIAGRINQELGQHDNATRLLEQLVKQDPSHHSGWELLVQLYQALGNREKRDHALFELQAAQRASLDPALRGRSFVLRDRIQAGGRTLITRDNTDSGAGDFMKYVFVPIDQPSGPDSYLAVMADGAMTDSWQEAGMLAEGKRLFQLVEIHRSRRGRKIRTVYEIYPDLPDYDRIRAKVIAILSGGAKPLSGGPGGSAVPAGR